MLPEGPEAAHAPNVCPVEGSWHRALCTATYCITLFVGGCVVNIVGQVGPTLAINMHVSIAAIGNIFAAEGVGNVFGSSLIVRRPYLFSHVDPRSL